MQNLVITPLVPYFCSLLLLPLLQLCIAAHEGDIIRSFLSLLSPYRQREGQKKVLVKGCTEVPFHWCFTHHLFVLAVFCLFCKGFINTVLAIA
jgi:hypothetical protein